MEEKADSQKVAPDPMPSPSSVRASGSQTDRKPERSGLAIEPLIGVDSLEYFRIRGFNRDRGRHHMDVNFKWSTCRGKAGMVIAGLVGKFTFDWIDAGLD